MKQLLVGFDTETTGPDPDTARIVQIGVVTQTCAGAITYPPQTALNVLCDPGGPIPPGASAVHGITDEQVRGQPSDETCAWAFFDQMRAYDRDYDAVVLAGHNSTTYDTPLLERIAGHPRLLTRFPQIDTLTLATRAHPEAPDHKLGTLYKHLLNRDVVAAHDAVGDILMVLELVDYFSRGYGLCWIDLAEFCATPQVLETVHFGKHAGKRWSDVPYNYVKFIANNFARPSPDLVATVRHHFGLEFAK